MEDFLNDIPTPDLLAAINDISLPVMPDITLDGHPKDKADIFKLEARKSWDKTEEARCDFSYKPRLTHRAGFFFFSIWQKSVFGRTLTDIKTVINRHRVGHSAVALFGVECSAERIVYTNLISLFCGKEIKNRIIALIDLAGIKTNMLTDTRPCA